MEVREMEYKQKSSTSRKIILSRKTDAKMTLQWKRRFFVGA